MADNEAFCHGVLRFCQLSSRKVRCNGECPCSSCLASNRECAFDQAKGKRRRKLTTIQPTSKSIRPVPYLASVHHTPITNFHPPSVQGDQQHSAFNNPTTTPASLPQDIHPPRTEYAGSAISQAGKKPSEPNGALKVVTHSSDHLPGHPLMPIRIPYFRFLGPTAIAPGGPFREISMKLVRENQPNPANSNARHRTYSTASDRTSPLSAPLPSTNQNVSSCSSNPWWDPCNDSLVNLTTSEFRSNVDIFYDHMGSFLSCMRKTDILHSLSQGKASEALKLAISALAECIKPTSSSVDHAEIRSRRAKMLCVPHLSLPSLDTTYTLLLIAYCEFGRDKDSGLWMWSGLAFRMATDLGLHKSVSVSPDSESSAWDQSESTLRQRIFWSCYHLDRLISSGTGRVATLLDSEVEIELPPMSSIPKDVGGVPETDDKSLLYPFHHLTQILILLGQISDTFNRSKQGDLQETLEAPAVSLRRFRAQLHAFYVDLPPILYFTVDNARRYHRAKQGQAFILLHLWFHSLVIITHTPTSVGPGWSSIDVGSIEPSMLEWSRGSVRTISDMLQFIHMLDPDLYRSVPFASQPIMIAGLASIPHRSQSLHPSHEGTKPSDWRDFEICSMALRTMQNRWRGVSWLVSTLQSRASYETDVDLTTSGGAEVSTCDSSLMNKLVEKTGATLFGVSDLGQRASIGQCVVGLSASGTLHEPATGRLSLVRHPDLSYCQAAAVSTSSVPVQSENALEGRPWQTSSTRPSVVSVTHNQPVDNTNTCPATTDQTPQDNSREHGETNSLDLTKYSSVESSGSMDPRHLDTGQRLQYGDQPPSSSSWMTHPVPLSFWPDISTLDSSLYGKQEQATTPSSTGRLLSNERPIEPHPGRLPADQQDRQTSSGVGVDVGANRYCGGAGEEEVRSVLGKEIWDELFRGEIGVWSSFEKNQI